MPSFGQNPPSTSQIAVSKVEIGGKFGFGLSLPVLVRSNR
jgi:hypothetical protein